MKYRGHMILQAIDTSQKWLHTIKVNFYQSHVHTLFKLSFETLQSMALLLL